MGNLSWGDAITGVRGELGGRASLTGAQIRGWLTAGLWHIAQPSVFRHPELYFYDTVTLTAAGDYVIPETLVDLERIFFVGGVRNSTAGREYPLVAKDSRWFRERMRSVAGRPGYYQHYNTAGVDTLGIYPLPSAEYVGETLEVKLYALPELETEGGDVFPFGAEWDEVMVAGGVWRGWRHLQQFAMAKEVRGDYAGLINDIREREGFEQEEDPKEWDISVGTSVQRFSP